MEPKQLQGMLSRKFTRALAVVALFIVLAALPWLGTKSYYISFFFLMFMYVSLAEAWNVIGTTGYLSFGHASFFGLGAYTTAMLLSKLGWNPFLTAPLGGLLAGAFAFLVGYPCLRLRGPYFALITLVLNMALIVAMLNFEWTGSTVGLWLSTLPFKPATSRAVFYEVMLLLTAAILYTTYRMWNSRLGRGLVAVREDEDMAMTLGINNTRVKMQAFVLSAAMTGMVGGIYSFYRTYVHPDLMFDINISILVVLMAVFGGTRYWQGPAVGAVILTVVSDQLTQRIGSEISHIIYGLLFILVILFLPEGIMGLLGRIGRKRAPGGSQESPKSEVDKTASPPSVGLNLCAEDQNNGHQGENGVILEVRKVSKRFGGLQALSDVSFQVRKGETLGLIGPNGAGKTTLFNVITGFYKPENGNILFSNREITGLAPHEIARLGIGRTFQIVRCFPHLTALENVAVGCLYAGRAGSRSEALEQAAEILDFCGMLSKGNHPAGKLTLSEKKRLEIARALSIRPQILLLDEVFAGLNEVEVVEAAELVRRMVEERGITVIMIEHVMTAVMKCSSRLIVLDYGKVIAEGSPQEIVENPAVIEAYLGVGNA
ncbi:MAG: branched-chain amino acid ABC transporter ATP-binding protein/permease [Actinobacteria bacterium]|nr:branched-chain amino acid ABC transporter ATP-binding protein/permease [Actinomycetota bacterium]